MVLNTKDGIIIDIFCDIHTYITLNLLFLIKPSVADGNCVAEFIKLSLLT